MEEGIGWGRKEELPASILKANTYMMSRHLHVAFGRVLGIYYDGTSGVRLDHQLIDDLRDHLEILVRKTYPA